MRPEENFYISHWCHLFLSTVRFRGLLQFWHCECWKDFNTAVTAALLVFHKESFKPPSSF